MKFGKIRIRQAALCLALAANLGGTKIPPLDLPGNQLRSITTLNSGRQVVVTFHAVGDYRFEKFELDNPKRLVIDLIRLRNAVRPSVIRINSESVRQINISQLRNQNPPITRVTMNLGSQNSGYTVARQGTRVQVVFGAGSQKAAPAATSAAKITPAATTVALPKTEPETPAAEAPIPEVAVSPAAVPSAPVPAPAPAPVPVPDAPPIPAEPAPATETKAAPTPSASTKLPVVDNSTPEYFKARSLKLNPRGIRVRPYLDRPFGAASDVTSPETVQQPPENPPQNEDAGKVASKPVALAPTNVAPIQLEELKSVASAIPIEGTKPLPALAEVARPLPSPTIAALSLDSAALLLRKPPEETEPAPTPVLIEPATEVTASALALPETGAENSKTLPAAGAAVFYIHVDAEPLLLPKVAVETEPDPDPAVTPAARVEPDAPTAEPKKPALSEPAKSKLESPVPALPEPAQPPSAVPALALPVAAESIIPTAAPAGVSEPAPEEPRKTIPVQMSPEAALSITLATGNAPSVKSPSATVAGGKPASRLPAPKSGTRPAPTVTGSAKAETTGLPQQLAAARPTPGRPGIQLSPTPPPLQASTALKYSGEAIDLKVKDLDLVDFFRMMSEISGLNISVDPDVGGKITMSMGAVPWDQIFDLALVTHRLDKKIEGNVVRVARKETLQSEETSKKSMKQAVEDAQDTQYMSFRLNYAEAKTLSESLKEQLSSRGQVIFDERTNTVIVSDLPKKLLDMSQLVKTLDVPEPQVIIESRIVQATRSFAREIGMNLGFAAGNGQRVTVGAPPMVSAQVPGILNQNVNLAATRQNGVLGIKVGNIFDTFLLDAAISAGEQKGIAKLLSEPKVTAQNNREATIRQGVRFPVQVIQNNTVSVIFQDAALTLKVTPKITDAGTVLLNLKVENNVADFTRSVNGIPSIQTSESETRVLVPSGGTTVIGGILIDEDRNTDDKVPGMASIPIFGHLFKKRSSEKRTQEVLFFVTPRIDQ